MPVTIKTLLLNDAVPSQPPDSVKPTVRQIVDDVVLLWREEPSSEGLEISRLYQKVQKRHVEWQLEEDVLRDTLIKHSLYFNDESQLNTYDDRIEFPPILLKKSYKKVDIACNNEERKLLAKTALDVGDLIYTESSPIVVIPPMDKMALIKSGKACIYCGNSLSNISSHFIIKNGLDCNDCNGVWCTKTCRKNDIIHSALYHDKSKNKSKITIKSHNWILFAKYCQEKLFVAAYSVGIIFAKILLSNEEDSTKTRAQFESLAQVSQRIRINLSDSTNIGGTLDITSGAMAVDDPESVWQEAYSLFTKTFPMLEGDIDLERFLCYIGKFNINQISNQVYQLTSLANHSCEPNARYEIDSKLELKVYARRKIKPGEEIFLTYVNPLHGVNLRRRELRVNWGFLCKCSRCLKELKYSKLRINSETSQLKVLDEKKRRKSSMKSRRPDLTELLKNPQEFDLEIPETLGFGGRRRTSVRFDSNVTFAVEE
ncbi:hypothetical protein KAFR_0B07000 [Kazachstania africana CBS 2517]|uniref:Histone-lysine N-methyltransferase SET5 n=1 Tax=Kazachstania africana (strain ATCC 22294 / BCRC 22015 / CBS 2517 / CECT 1963 / NBRC 1671 / NRRL Y-8276) TaxID=1071382 RepID=H2ARJ8_KAZAF|nr:hypothetical protein KAFR_0B07000 [Kazachstania africana CBS 2517]CCF56998.1 hypothetical protein KAFR_0B07000 [Kazachstania africana CBS 2517]